MDFRFALISDDEQIRQLIREIPLEGEIKLRYQYEPSYFAVSAIQGSPNQTIVGVVNGRVMAVASWNLQKVFVKGKSCNAGYLSNVRVHPSVRSGFSLIKGLKFLEEFVKKQETDFHFATLIDSNSLTRSLFASGRSSLPKFYNQGRVFTYSIPLQKRKRNPRRDKGLNVVKASHEHKNEIIAFLKGEGAKTDFFPFIDDDCYSIEIFRQLSFYIALDNSNSIIGVCSVGDFTSFKQHVLEGFTLRFRLVVFLLSLLLKIMGAHSIPKKGQKVLMLYAGFTVVKNHDAHVFKSLLSRVFYEYSGTGFHYITLALHENNPFIDAMKKFTKICYTSRLYFFNFGKNQYPLSSYMFGSQSPYIDLFRL
ncbi:MAG: hypothetical protein ACLFNU_10480 [Bacteroidales bacterium]